MINLILFVANSVMLDMQHYCYQQLGIKFYLLDDNKYYSLLF